MTLLSGSECPTQATPPQATLLSLDILLQVRSPRSPLRVSIRTLVAFHQWAEVLTHQLQVVATQELEATPHLEVIQPLGAILGVLQPTLEAKALGPHPAEQAFLAIHSHLHSLMAVDQPRFQSQVAFLEGRCRLSTPEDKLPTLASLLR